MKDRQQSLGYDDASSDFDGDEGEDEDEEDEEDDENNDGVSEKMEVADKSADSLVGNPIKFTNKKYAQKMQGKKGGAPVAAAKGKKKR